LILQEKHSKTRPLIDIHAFESSHAGMVLILGSIAVGDPEDIGNNKQ
jgi:hypothetical protein